MWLLVVDVRVKCSWLLGIMTLLRKLTAVRKMLRSGAQEQCLVLEPRADYLAILKCSWF